MVLGGYDHLISQRASPFTNDEDMLTLAFYVSVWSQMMSVFSCGFPYVEIRSLQQSSQFLTRALL